MSHGTQAGAHHADVNSRLIVLYGVAFTVIVAVLVFWLRDYFFVVRNDTVRRNVLESTNPKLLELRAYEDSTLGSYGWVDRDKGVVRIPIERAMELLATEAANSGDGVPAGEEGAGR